MENENPNTCRIWRAAVLDDMDLARSLIEEGADVDESEDGEGGYGGDTALVFAAFNDKPNWVEFLLAAGAGADISDASGLSPLACACLCGSVECARLLIAHGCQMDALDDDGETAVMLAAIEGCSDIVAMLLEAGCSLAGFEEKGWALLGPDKYIGRLDEHCAQMIAAEWERRELRGQVARLDEKSRLGAKSL